MKKGVVYLGNKKGITLIALVITIVVLIILAAVAVNLTLGENGLFNKAKYSKELHEYEAAKEAIQLKLANLKLECQAEGKSLTKDEIISRLEDPNETNVYIEGYIYELVAAVRPGVVKKTKDDQNRDIRVKDVVLSTKEESSIKFSVDDGGEITGVVKDVEPTNNGDFTNVSFTDIDEFEQTIGAVETTPEPTPTPEPILADSTNLQVGDVVNYRNTRFIVNTITGTNVKLTALELKAHMYFRGNTNDATAVGAKDRIWSEVNQTINAMYADTSHSITAESFRYADGYEENYRQYFNSNVQKIFYSTYLVRLGSAAEDPDGTATAIYYYTLNGDTLERDEMYHIYFVGWGPHQNVDGNLDAYIPVNVYMDKNCINLYESGWKCVY